MKNEGDIRLLIRQALKLHVLEEVILERKSKREVSVALSLTFNKSGILLADSEPGKDLATWPRHTFWLKNRYTLTRKFDHLA
ncbi:MAG TPA: hypothetical protein PLK59_09040 [Synergistales bacterium]|nr:hypothetical protein [Synergistales bacterium]